MPTATAKARPHTGSSSAGLRVTLLGGTGFIGRALAARLVGAGRVVRVVARNAESARSLPEGVDAVSADVADRNAMHSLLAGSDAAVYLPGQVQGWHRRQFETIHKRAAQQCAEIARQSGLTRFVYLSALGAEANAAAWSDQTKAEGEHAVLAAFPEAVVVRPSLVFGDEDHFTNEMTGLMRRLPVLPVIGPRTRIQPVHIADLVEALYQLLAPSAPPGALFQAAGPRVWQHLDLLTALRDHAGIRCRLLPMPEWAAMVMARVAGILPEPPLCPDQVRLMRSDKVADTRNPGLTELGISPRDAF